MFVVVAQGVTIAVDAPIWGSLLTYFKDFETHGLTLLAFLFTVKDHNFVLGRAETLFSCYFKYESDELLLMLDQMRRHFVANYASAGVDLSNSIWIDGAG